MNSIWKLQNTVLREWNLHVKRCNNVEIFLEKSKTCAMDYAEILFIFYICKGLEYNKKKLQSGLQQRWSEEKFSSKSFLAEL